MEDWSYLAVYVVLRPDTPDEVLTYLRALIDPETAPSDVATPAQPGMWWSDVAPPVNAFSWTDGVVRHHGALERDSDAHPWDPDTNSYPFLPEDARPWHFRLHGYFDEDFEAEEYGLLGLLAHHAIEEQIIASGWSATGAVSDTYLARDRHLYRMQSGNRPGVLVDLDGTAPSPPVGYATRASVEDLECHGVPRDIAAVWAAADESDPRFARYLLVRSLHRAICTGLGSDPTEVTGTVLRQVLECLDAGADVTASTTAPGWELVEVLRPGERWDRRTYRTLEPLCDLAPDVARCDLDVGPTPFIPGMVVRTTSSITMTARTFENVLVTPAQAGVLGSGGRESHVLVLQVPADIELLVARVSPEGSPWFSSARWPEWVVGPQSTRTFDYPLQPLIDPEEYTIFGPDAHSLGATLDVVRVEGDDADSSTARG